MAEYIDRAEAIKAVCRKCTACSVLTDKDDKAFSKAHCAEIRALQELPAADVKPVERGRWEETGGFSDEMIDWVRCSRCGEEAPGFTDNYNFCPHCGADMREGEEE